MADRPLSLHDTAVVNLAAMIMFARVHDPKEQAMNLDLLAEVVNKANWDHPEIAPLVDAVRKMIDVLPVDRGAPGAIDPFLRLPIEAALARIFRWRFACAYDAAKSKGVAA